MSLSGDIILETLTTMALLTIFITEKLAHIQLLEKMFNLNPNTSQSGDTTQVTPITMVHSLISTTEKHPHTMSIWMMVSMSRLAKRLPMNQNGDTTLETLTTMDHSPISTTVKPPHIM